MKQIVKIVYIMCSMFLLYYVSIPSFPYPEPPKNVVQSNEPADIETPLRRGYFTDLNRNDVISHYQQSYSGGIFSNAIFNFRLNYPPEEAQTLIRDQAKSSFLEEIVHPLRESIYVNGFEPKEDKDRILVNGKEWKQKITIKSVASRSVDRFIITVAIIILFYILAKQWLDALSGIKEGFKKLWIYR